MTRPVLPVAVVIVGAFLGLAAVAAIAAGAAVPAAVFAALAVAHLVVAIGLGRASLPITLAGGVLGISELALLGIGAWFIGGIEAGIGVDLGAAWFAPLNGYATIAVAVLIASVALGLVRAAIRSGRAAAAVAIAI